jgi:hypothetical protein
MAAVELVYHFAPTTADVRRAATPCHRWRALACADSVWRAKFRREKLLEKARLFEVALPAVPVPGGQGQGGAAAAAAVAVKDEAAGVGLAFYAQVFALKVAHRSVARNDSVIIRSHLAPRCCGFRCSRLFACGGGVAASHQGGSPSERSSSLNRTPASGSTSGGILRPARGGAGTGGEMRTLPWMEEEVTLARVIAVGGVRGTAPQKRCCRCGGSLNRTVTVQLGDEGVLVQVDSDALDHAANPLPVSCVE